MAALERIAKRLKTTREAQRLSVVDLAHAAGMFPREIRAIEGATVMPTAAQFEALATALGMTVYTFVARSIPQTRSGEIVAPEMKLIHYGHGRNEEEAHAAKIQSKLDGMPFFDIDVPDDITVEEVEALTNECLMLLGNPIVLLNSVLRSVTNEAVPKRMIDKIRLNLHEMLQARWATFITLEAKGAPVRITFPSRDPSS